MRRQSRFALLVLFAPAPLVSAQAEAQLSQGAGSPAKTPAPQQHFEELKKAVREFRRVTAEANLQPGGQGEGEPFPAGAGRTSAWHGRVFEYFRNDLLDAVPHEVVQRGGESNLRRRNQFGFTVNGPVVMPGIYDGRGAAFFTFSYEGTRERVGRSYLYTVPTEHQRLADFSGLVNRAGLPRTIYDPASTRRNPTYDASRPVAKSNLEHRRDAFANNRIPAMRIDSVARRAAETYPLPNTNVGPFLRNNYWVNPSESNTPDGFIARVDVSVGKTQKVTAKVNASDGFADTPDLFPAAGNPGRPDRMFKNREIEVADTVNLTPNLSYRGSFEAGFNAIDTISPREAANSPAELGLSGVSGTVFPALRFSGYIGLGAPRRSYLRNALADYQVDNELILRSGKHTWTVVSDGTFVQLNTLELDTPSGYFSFNDRITGLPGVINTGDGFATFLLGQAWRAEATDQPNPAYLRRMEFENSVSDQWQVTSSLTLTLRLNVATSSPRKEKYNRQSSFDPAAANPSVPTPGALVFAGRDGEGHAFQAFRVRMEPRVGVSWSPTSSRNTVVRWSLLRFYSALSLRSGPFGTQGFSGRRFPLSPNRQLVPAVTLEDGLAPLPNPLPDLRGDFANDTDVDMIPRTAAQPTYGYASMEVEHRFPLGLSVRARGRVYRGRDMLIGGQIAGLNRAPVGSLVYRDRLNVEEFRRSLRPFPQVQQVRMNYQYPGGRYRYDEGSVNLKKRTGDGLSFDLEYRHRWRWDDYSGPGIQDASDRRTAWARARGTRPQRLSLMYTYEFPFGPGEAMLARGGLWAKLASNWSMSGFTTWHSGDPIVLEPLFNNTGGIVPYLRVNAVPGVDPHVADPGPESWFNAAAFVDPPDFSLGNVPRTHPTLRNPAYTNHDISVSKRMVLTKEQTVELLVQGFNFINQGNWNDPDTEIGPAHARNVNAGKIIGSRGGRVLQIGLRYHF